MPCACGCVSFCLSSFYKNKDKPYQPLALFLRQNVAAWLENSTQSQKVKFSLSLTLSYLAPHFQSQRAHRWPFARRPCASSHSSPGMEDGRLLIPPYTFRLTASLASHAQSLAKALSLQVERSGAMQQACYSSILNVPRCRAIAPILLWIMYHDQEGFFLGCMARWPFWRLRIRACAGYLCAPPRSVYLLAVHIHRFV